MATRWNRTLTWLGLTRDSADVPLPSSIIAPRRDYTANWVSPETAVTLSTVFRGIGIHATAASQLSLSVWRNGARMPNTPGIIAKPDIDESASAFFEYLVVSLYIDGNAFLRLIRADSTSSHPGEVVDVKPLNPREVSVYTDPATNRTVFKYRGDDLPARDIRHLKFLRMPGHDRGLGPLQAAQTEIRGALDARDYGSQWFRDSDVPNGILSTDQVISPDQAKTYKDLWKGRNPDGSVTPNGHDIRVMGQGLSYTPLMLKPADVQFLESQKFSTTQIARLLGVPASLMLAVVEGNSSTYSNVEQDWIAYVRFSLMKALREIEEAMTSISPRGQVARFNLDGLLRTDTKSRYEAHAIGLNAGFLTVNEVRALEGLAPLPDGDKPSAKPAPTPAPIEEPTDADA